MVFMSMFIYFKPKQSLIPTTQCAHISGKGRSQLHLDAKPSLDESSPHFNGPSNISLSLGSGLNHSFNYVTTLWASTVRNSCGSII